jgi:hypothetical protein
MRRFLLVTTLAAAWAAMPSTGTVIGTASFAAASLLFASEVQADTALQPGWRHACGRNPRCFEHGEYRRQLARLRAQSAATSKAIIPARSQTNAPARP